jgi:hypothetical protein
MTEVDPVRDAEFHEANYLRVEGDIREALRRSGCILPAGVVEALTCTALEESLQTRRRMAYMLHIFVDYYGDSITPKLLERLEAVLLMHHRDKDNLGFMPSTDDDS